MDKSVTATCPYCGSRKCKCPRPAAAPTPAQVAVVAVIGARTLAAWQAAAARGHRLTFAVVGGRAVAIETFDD